MIHRNTPCSLLFIFSGPVDFASHFVMERSCVKLCSVPFTFWTLILAEHVSTRSCQKSCVATRVPSQRQHAKSPSPESKSMTPERGILYVPKMGVKRETWSEPILYFSWSGNGSKSKPTRPRFRCTTERKRLQFNK